jgi:xylono-1,5-lactonase
MSGAVRIIARDRSDLLGEGPVWSARESALLMIGWVIERAAAPGFIAGFASGFAELTLEPLRIEPIVDPEPDRPQNRLNDAKADHCGRIWAGSMPVAANEPSGCLYCLHVDRAVTRVDSGYTIANGPALSPDGSVLYHTDSALRVIYKFRLHEDGSLSDRAPFIEFQTSWGQTARWHDGRSGRRSVGRALRRQLRQPFPRGRTPRSQHRAACLADHELCFRLIGFAG